MDDREVFVAVVEAGSFTAAATRLGVSVSHVSKRVRALEEALGARLFVRTTRHVAPTEAGERYHLRVAPLLRGLREADAEAGSGTVEPRGTVRIAAPLAFGLRHVVPVLNAFQRAWPDVKVDASFRDDRVDPLLYDLTLRGGTLDTGLVGRRLCAITSRLAASPGYLDAHGRPTHPRELVGHRLLRYTATPSVRPWTFTRDGEVAEIDVDAAYSADSGEALVAAAVAGLGVANEPDFLVDAHLASGALELLLPDWKGFSAHFWALTPSRFPSAATRAILDALDENLRSSR